MNQLKRLFTLFLCSLLMIAFISQPTKDIIKVNKVYTTHVESSESLDRELEKRKELSKESRKMVAPVSMIMIRDDDLDIVSSGTGFSIKYNRKENVSYILTNEHICSDMETGYTITSISSINHSSTISYTHYDITLEIMFSDPRHDLCLLKRGGKVKPVRLTDNIPAQMDTLTVIGAPHGNFPIMINSLFSGYLGRHEAFQSMIEPGYSYLMLSEIFHGGVSGSPIYDKKGEVVGIIFGNLGKWNGYYRTDSYGGLGIQTAEIKHFLEENNFEL